MNVVIKALVASSLFGSAAFSHGFVAGTEVSVGSEIRLVEEIRVGDEVLSCDQFKCEVSGKVSRVFETEEAALEIHLSSVRGEEDVVVGASETQSFLTSNDDFIVAKELKVGSFVVGKASSVYSVDSIVPQGLKTVFTFSVLPEHNFLAEGVFVHNFFGEDMDDEDYGSAAKKGEQAWDTLISEAKQQAGKCLAAGAAGAAKGIKTGTPGGVASGAAWGCLGGIVAGSVDNWYGGKKK